MQAPRAVTTISNSEESIVRPYMPELDTLRGVAVLGVLLYHAFAWRYSPAWFGPWARAVVIFSAPGWTGVNLFFVLSGFLITGILLHSKDQPNFYRRFYTRRALRILPAYYALLILLLALRSSSYAFVGLSFIYLSNMTEFFGVACGYGPLWSLAVEEHFYIVWPAVVRNFSARSLAKISSAIILLVPLLRAVSSALGWGGGVAWYTWFVADGLAAGSLLAIVLRRPISRTEARRLCGCLLAAALLAAAAGAPLGILKRSHWLGAGLQFTLLHVFFAGFLLLVLLAGSGAGKRFVNFSGLRFLGYISYGLYLDHLLVFRVYDRICEGYWPQLIPSQGHFDLVLLRFAVAAGSAIGLAYISRRFFEEKFLRMKDALVPKASSANIKLDEVPAPSAQPRTSSPTTDPSPVLQTDWE